MAKKAGKKSKGKKGGKKKGKKAKKKFVFTAARREALEKTQRANKKKSKPAKRKSKPKAAKKRKSGKRKTKRKTKRSRGGRSTSRSTSSSSRVVRTEKVRVVRVPKKGTQAVHVTLAAGGKKRKKRRGGKKGKRRSNPDTSLALRPNPGPGGLFSNEGPFTGQKMKNYAVAILGVGLGLVVTDVADRFAATWTPSSASNGTAEVEGQRPWYGKNAAAAIRRRPGALRLGVQLAIGVGAIALGYWTRNKPALSWFFGGLSVGAGARLFESLFVWYGAPMLLKVGKGDEQSLANRLFSFEQADVQDPLDKAFDEWPKMPGLMAAQTVDNPTIAEALPTGLQGLPSGKAGSGSPSGTTGAPRREFIKTGRLGDCGGCGGNKGCYSDCSGYKCGACKKMDCAGNCCPDCQKKCRYMMQPGDDIRAMASAAGVDMSVLFSLNGGPEFNAAPGAWVILPYPMCVPINERMNGGGAPMSGGTVPASTQVTSSTTPVIPPGAANASTQIPPSASVAYGVALSGFNGESPDTRRAMLFGALDNEEA